MINWAKQQLANVAGTQEPEYGTSAIQAVGSREGEPEHRETTRDDLKWSVLKSTCVETQTFYFMADSGHMGFVQVIYNNVAGLRTTCQFNTKVFFPDDTPTLWSSDPLEEPAWDEDKLRFSSDTSFIEVNDEATVFRVRSVANEDSMVGLEFERTSPGFVAGKDGTSYFGPDAEQPWGSMRHVFWPRCVVRGVIKTPKGEIDCSGRGSFVHALQGMKPHHAAARWNFANFQSDAVSASIMEFTTPPSYGSTVVRVACIAADGKLVLANTGGDCTHTETRDDADNGWAAPTAVRYHWQGEGVQATLEGGVDQLDRIDVMAEVPGFIKTIVASAAGTKPFIYQFARRLPLRMQQGDEEKTDEGILFAEATFIS